MKRTLIPEHLQVTAVTFVVLILYVVALIFPDSWWGLHYPAFLGGFKAWGVVIITILLTLYAQKYPLGERVLFTEKSNLKSSWIWSLVLSIIVGILFYQLPIYHDTYGDALKLLPDLDMTITDLDAKFTNKIFNINFTDLKLGTGTTVGLVGWISYNYDITVYEAFRALGVFCGIGFTFFMLLSVFRVAKNHQQRVLFALMVLGAPLTLVFCGHVEIYAPVYFLLAVFWYTLIRFLQKPSWIAGILMVFLCFMNLKFHSSGLLTFILAGLTFVLSYAKSREKTVTWKQLFSYVLLPIGVIGILVYVFVTKSIFGPRSFTEDNLFDAIFLPIRSTEAAPLDRYNLFSWNHFFDFFNLTFFWSSLALIILVAALFFKRKSVQWNNSLVQIGGIGTIVFTLLFFVINPLLSMPNDWDLMSIPAVTLIVFAGAIVTSMESSKTSERGFASYLIAPAFGLLLIGWSGHIVNANQESLSSRLLSMGKYTYKTYWIGSSTPILKSVALLDNQQEQKEVLESTVSELAPYAVDGRDIEFAAITHELGEVYRKSNDFDQAYAMYKRSFQANSTLTKNVKILDQLLEYRFLKKEFQVALEIAEMLVQVDYPNALKARRVAIHTALEAKEYEVAKKYCQQLLNINSNDTFIREILDLIEHSEDRSQIKLRFRQS